MKGELKGEETVGLSFISAKVRLVGRLNVLWPEFFLYNPGEIGKGAYGWGGKSSNEKKRRGGFSFANNTKFSQKREQGEGGIGKNERSSRGRRNAENHLHGDDRGEKGKGKGLPRPARKKIGGRILK